MWDIAFETFSDGTTVGSQMPKIPELDVPAAADLVASYLLAEGRERRGDNDREGEEEVEAFALKVLYTFVCYNADWIQVLMVREANMRTRELIFLLVLIPFRPVS